MRYALLLCLLSSPSFAGSGKVNCETVTIASASCPAGQPGRDADGDLFGLSLQQAKGWTVRVCPVTAGATITGAAGSVRFCTYSPDIWMGGFAGWGLSPQFSVTLSTAYATDSDHPCLEMGQVYPVVRLSGERVYAYVSTDFAVSAGTQVRVCMFAEYDTAVQL